MSTETLKPESFTCRQIFSFRDDMDRHNWSLRAFGALLEYANLERFGDEFNDAGQYRCGLNGIVELITEQQERMVDTLVERYDRSPEYIIQAADRICKEFTPGMYRTHTDALNDIDKTIEKLNAVIENFDDEYPMAMELKRELAVKRQVLCKNMQGQNTERTNAG